MLTFLLVVFHPRKKNHLNYACQWCWNKLMNCLRWMFVSYLIKIRFKAQALWNRFSRCDEKTDHRSAKAWAFPPELVSPGRRLGGHGDGLSARPLPVCFIQDDDLVPSFGQGDFLLGKHFDFVPYNINAPGTMSHKVIVTETNSVTSTGGLSTLRAPPWTQF